MTAHGGHQNWRMHNARDIGDGALPQG